MRGAAASKSEIETIHRERKRIAVERALQSAFWKKRMPPLRLDRLDDPEEWRKIPVLTKENYEASIAAVHPGPGVLPDGQIFHAAGPSPGGWTIMAVHESKESWERFRERADISLVNGAAVFRPRRELDEQAM